MYRGVALSGVQGSLMDSTILYTSPSQKYKTAATVTPLRLKVFIELPSVGDILPEEVALVLSVEQDNGLELVEVRALVLLHLEILVISALLDEVKLGLAEGSWIC